MRLTFITSNAGKLKEAREILKDYDVENIHIDLPELQGEPKDIIVEKARLAATHIQGPFFVEDVSVCLDALNGLPGPYIKDFLKKLGAKGVYDLVANYNNCSAKAICSIAYYKDEEIKVFEGVIKGDIVSPRGKNHFGFDPIFQPEGSRKTFAEMTPGEKNSISHRRIALKKLNLYLHKKPKI